MRRLFNGLAAAALIGLPACGGNGYGGGSPTTPTPGGGTRGATVAIMASGVNPPQVTINTGQFVTFVNNDSRAHTINSNPHPSHGECPPINDVGGLSPNQSKDTGTFTTARTCGYHDHGDPTNAAMQGQIIIR